MEFLSCDCKIYRTKNFFTYCSLKALEPGQLDRGGEPGALRPQKLRAATSSAREHAPLSCQIIHQSYGLLLLLLGKISLAQWAFSMESILGLNLPWRSLRSHLVNIDSDGNVDYMSSFQDVHIEKPVKEVGDILVPAKNRVPSKDPLDNL